MIAETKVWNCLAYAAGPLAKSVGYRRDIDHPEQPRLDEARQSQIVTLLEMLAR